MARIKTLADRVGEIKRRYKRITSQKFAYNKKADLAARYKRIVVWFLIHDEQRGYSIMRIEFKRGEPMSVAEWTSLFKKGTKKYNSLYSIYTQAVLPAINNKGGNKWRFKSLLAWSGVSDSKQATHSSSSRKRNKTTKKGNARACRRNRVRF